MDMPSSNPPEEQASGSNNQDLPARPLNFTELEALAEHIIERMKKEMRLDLQREGKHT